MAVDVTKLREIQLNLLREFLRICEKYGLRYFALGGTAIGAVRHKGYIPWDDDIDLGLPRPDYEKFQIVAQAELKDGYFLQNCSTDPELNIPFSKLRDSNTTFIETSSRNLKINHGVYIDVFPIDGFPIDEKEAKKYMSSIKRDNLYLSTYSFKKRTLKQKLNFLGIRILYIGKNRNKVLLEYAKRAKKYPFGSTSMTYITGGAWGEKEISPLSQYGEGTKGVFEGIDIVIPAKYDEYLTDRYGNYMELPPEKDRVAHHYCDVIDLDRSYTDYMKR